MTRPSDIYLIRHAQSTWNAAGRWQGQADPPLSAHGRDQVEQLARCFPDQAVRRVVTSDLQRAHETAIPLAERFGVELQIDRDLREIDVGTWSGRTREEIGEEDPAALDLYFQGRVGWEGGETYEQHEARSLRAADRLDQPANGDVDIDGGGTVIAVTHGGTLRAIVLALMEIDPSMRWRFSSIGHTSITHLTRGEHGWRLVTFNSALDHRNA